MSSETRTKSSIPIRLGTRLTAWGTLFTLALCTLLCGILYAGLRISLHREVDAFLEGEVQEFLAILRDERDENLALIEKNIRSELGSRSRQDLSFRLLDETGRLIATSDPHAPLLDNWTAPPIPASDASHVWFETATNPRGGSPLRLCSQWTTLPGMGNHVAQATYALDGVAASLASFRRVCMASMVLVLGLSVLNGRLLARKTLSPLRQMNQTARRIGSENLSSRLDRTGNHDELDDLAAVLNDMLFRLEQQFKQIQQFTADAAHELRTPIAALRGSVEVALNGNASRAELRALLRDSVEEYDRVSCITDDLLLLAQADSGQPFLRLDHCSIDSAIADAIDLFLPLAEKKKIALEYRDGSSAQLYADIDRIRQVLCILLDNAIKYSSTDGKITVAVDQTPDHVTLSVADAGPGIPAIHLPHIFDRFYRGDEARSRHSGGSGLGLSICRTIVQAHGGAIDVKSGPNGSVFIVKLPRVATPRFSVRRHS